MKVLPICWAGTVPKRVKTGIGLLGWDVHEEGRYLLEGYGVFNTGSLRLSSSLSH